MRKTQKSGEGIETRSEKVAKELSSVKPAGSDAMQRCLNIPEILCMIFLHVQRYGSPKYGSPTHRYFKSYNQELASLARTCKAFHHPAIRILWETIPYLGVIEGLLGGALQQKDRSHALYLVMDPWETPASVLASVNKATFRKYAELVREVHYTSTHESWRGQIDRSRFLLPFALLQLGDQDEIPLPLFPNAKKIFLPLIYSRLEDAALYPPLLLGPSIKEVIIGSDVFNEDGGDDMWWKAVTTRLSFYAALLTSFSLEDLTPNDGGWTSPDKFLHDLNPVPELCNFFSSAMQSLDLHLAFSNCGAIVAMSKLANLSTLRISLAADSFAKADTVPALPFPSLQELSITAHGSTKASNIVISRVQAPHLRSLSLLFWIQNKRDDLPVDDTFQALSSISLRLRHLKILKYDSVPEEEDDMDLYQNGTFKFVVNPQTLAPLGRFTALETVDLGLECDTKDVTDAELLTMFKSWPNLVRFVAISMDQLSLRRRPQLTFAGVHKAIGHCPRLRHLALACDAAVPMEALLNDDSDLQDMPPALEFWDVGNSSLAHGPVLGPWLARRYPMLRDIKSFSLLRQEIREASSPDWDGPMTFSERHERHSTLETYSWMAHWNDVSRFLRNRNKRAELEETTL